MKRLSFLRNALAVLVLGLTAYGQSGSRFDVKLAGDKQALHVLNRLTFGPRAAELVAVRRAGVSAWIEEQLHPERIGESSVLESRLEPLTSLKLAPWEIQEKYAPPAQPIVQRLNPASLLTPLQMSKLMNGGTPDERRAVIVSLEPAVRAQVMGVLPAQAFDGLLDLQQEANVARTAASQAQLQQLRQQTPALNSLLTPDQMRTLRTGSDPDKIALIMSLDPDKRRQVIRAAGPQVFATIPQLRREALGATQPQQLVNAELIDNKLYRAIYSNHQLEEVLVDFWVNHFNVFNGKGQARVLLTSFERDAIRPHVFGRFRDMLMATARHPAMLIYLDNAQSQAPREDLLPTALANGSPIRRPGLNENYGRELMELHTLGVDGGYTQDDVLAVARAFTGWTVYDPQKYAEFQFNAGGHDRKEKIVLGNRLPPGRGEQDGVEVIDILARHPSTAKFISKKLAQRFVADEPPQALVDRMAATFTKTNGDLRAVLQTLFASTEFLSEGAWLAKLKSPLEMVVSAVRALNADADDVTTLAQRIAELGQPLYGKVEPTGYPNTGESWASTSGLLGRINFATTLTAGQVQGIKPDLSRYAGKAPAAVAADLLFMTPSRGLLQAMEKGLEGKEVSPLLLTTVVLGSPEFQRR